MLKLQTKDGAMFYKIINYLLINFVSEKVNLEARLLGELMEGYNRDARPIADVTRAIDVSIAFYITKILNLVSTRDVIASLYLNHACTVARTCRFKMFGINELMLLNSLSL